MNDKITMITKLFEGKEIRSVWNSEEEDFQKKKRARFRQNVGN